MRQIGVSSRSVLSAFMLLALICSRHSDSWAQDPGPEFRDPVMIKENNTYYVFGTGTGISVLASQDMTRWEPAGPVFESGPDWTRTLIPDFSQNALSSPAIFYREGMYYLYYSASTTGSNRSAIGVATSKTLNQSSPDYAWTDHGPVVNSVAGRDHWNAVAPQIVEDPEGAPWICFGSFWEGLKLARMDRTLFRISQNPAEREWHSIAGRHRYEKLDERDGGDAANPDLDFGSLYPREVIELNRSFENGAISAPYIISRNGAYYLLPPGAALPTTVRK